MSDQKKEDVISVIYSTRNDSPKHILIPKKKLVYFFVVLPLLAIIGLSLGVIGLINSSPFHLIQNYKINNEAHEVIKQSNQLRENLRRANEENINLKNEIQNLKKTAEQKVVATETASPDPKKDGKKEICPPTPVCPNPKTDAPMTNSIGLSTLSFFKPIQMQKDKTRPASLILSDFKAIVNRETLNFQFNINNQLGGDVKLAGHIIVLMKNEQMIEVYPMNALNSARDYQMTYTSGEPFATQRFRPVDATFPKPKKGGNFVFTVFIFAKNGDLIHYQTVYQVVKI